MFPVLSFPPPSPPCLPTPLLTPERLFAFFFPVFQSRAWAAETFGRCLRLCVYNPRLENERRIPPLPRLRERDRARRARRRSGSEDRLSGVRRYSSGALDFPHRARHRRRR